MPVQCVLGGRRFLPAPADREYPQLPTVTIRDLNRFFFLLAEPDPRNNLSNYWIKPGKYEIRDGDVTGKFEFEATGKTEAKFTFSFIGPEFAIPPLTGVALNELEWVDKDEVQDKSSDETSGNRCLKPKLAEDGEFIFHPHRGFITTPNTKFTQLNPISYQPYVPGGICLRTRGDMVFSMCAPVRGYIIHASGLEGFEHVRTESST